MTCKSRSTSEAGCAEVKHLAITRIKRDAVAACRYQTFAELAAVVLACQFLKKGRTRDARRVLKRFMELHASTPRIVEAMRLTYHSEIKPSDFIS